MRLPSTVRIALRSSVCREARSPAPAYLSRQTTAGAGLCTFDPVKDRLLAAAGGRALGVNVAIATCAFLLAALETALIDAGGPFHATALGVALTTLPIALRSVAPVAVVAVTTWGYTISVILGFPADDLFVATFTPMIAIALLAADVGGLRVLLGAGAAISAYGAATLWAPPEAAADLALALVVVGASVAVGTAMRIMGIETDVLQDHARELEAESEVLARSAVERERARIARELHDVVGHSISVMGLQAGAVRRRLDDSQTVEREALLAIERVGRDAVDEMRRLLGLLRDRDDASAPPMTLERIEAIVRDMRAAGLNVELFIEKPLADLPPGRALATVRIVQEALTNVMKHAPTARATVHIEQTNGCVQIDVADDGRTTRGKRREGHGLIGMRERVALYNGTFAAGPAEHGGFRVTATIPVGSS